VNADDGTETTRDIHNLKYYPITDEGLEVAKFDNGNAPSTLHREQKYIYSNIESKHVLKMDKNNFRGYQKTLYDNIIAEL
jgi:hypothetical protein